MQRNAIWILLPALTLLTAAAPPAKKKKEREIAPICQDAHKILDKIEDCSQNTLYIKAAKDCAADFTLGANNLALEAKNLFAANQGGNQRKELSAAAKSYDQMAKKLIAMISTAERSRIAVANYSMHLVLPDEDGADPAPCFDDAKKALEKIGDELDQKQREVETTLQNTLTLLEATRKERDNTQGLGGPLLTNPIPSTDANKAPTPAAKDKNAGSTISGTIKEEKKK